MFADEYVLPGFRLVQQHQRIILHTLILLALGSLLFILGSLVSIIPAVAGFTLSGISISDLTIEQLANLISGNTTILAGACGSFILFVLNISICTSLYLGGIIQEVVDPKPQLIPAVRTAFSSIRLTLKPLIFIAFISIIIGLFGLITGWGLWLLTQVWFLGSVLIFFGVSASIMFLFLSSLTLIISNMEKTGVIDSVKNSIAIVNKDSINYFVMFTLIILVNLLVLLLPIFGVLITLITVPVSVSAMVGYYYINQEKTGQPTQTAPAPPKPEEKAPATPKAAQQEAKAPAEPKPEVKEEAPHGESDEERTKRILSKILRDL